MKFAQKALLAALSSAALVAGSEAPSDVLDLTESSFNSVVDPEPLMLVEFFAPWCGHCQALKPHYEEAATTLKDEGIKLAKVDCTVEEKVCSDQQVGGYPTLKVFRNGSPSDYAGTRKADGIISYMQKQALPAVSHVTSANLSDFKQKDKVVAVAFLSDGDSAERKVYTELADANRDDYMFGLVTDAEAAKAAGVTAPAVVLYRKFDEPEVKYDGEFNGEDIKAFLAAERVPLIDEVGPENFMTYFESGLPLAYYFTEPEAENLDTVLAGLKPLAKEHKGKMNFVWIDAVKFVNHAKGLNLRGESWPSFAIQDIQGSTKYPVDDLGKDPVQSIHDFTTQYLAGKLKPSIKSEPVPKEQDGPVHVLVADEFDLIFDEKKDVLVEFYAPWCGHCKKLAPTYDTLGEKYAAHKDKVMVAKMDATANDVPPSAGFQVQSFPTIKFKPAGSKAFVDFEGDRSLESFIDFISLNGKSGVKVSAEANDSGAAPVAEKAPSHEEL
ncbi:hypothetical protein BDZ90DRAFT_233311 [Jaminaea rosea]|uniref:Protein disulfide-isomerase n=1 Tax=Jaminaea rosea TaxID=1569628 RepID=A0A316ULP7_9BASI|nr:hypothetical protein BDZ90DRAFT_233311 [Jaminaea rosea]PWN26169.1 hypothetical protein BDZ90DRAFT_233311 [Jaminaea rosea]